MKTIRIGSGAGYGGDRIEPAIDLIKRGNLVYSQCMQFFLILMLYNVDVIRLTERIL